MAAFERGRPEGDERLRSALADASIGIWELDRAAGVLLLTAASPTLLGLPPDKPVVLQTFLERLHADDRERVGTALLASSNGGGGGYRDEYRTIAGAEGVTPRFLSARAVTSDGRLIGTLCDISEHRRLEEQRDELSRRLAGHRRSHELLARVLGHDLRGPVASMLTSTEVATRRTTDDRLLQPLSRVLATGNQLTRMIDQLLDFSTIAFLGGLALDLQPTDAAAIARALVEELRLVHPGRAIELSTTGDMRGVWDANRVGQVLTVLIGNALQHGQAETPMTVVVDGSGRDEVKLSVHNHGVVPPELIDRVFEAFRGADRKRAGASALGLGLHVVRHVALAHGGEAAVTSSEEHGTTMTVTLPRSPPRRAEQIAHDEIEEVIALERLAAIAPAASVTAQMYGVLPLHQRNPTVYWSLHERYGRLLMLSLQRQMYKGGRDDLTEEVRAMAEELGELRAGPREVAELHARALRQKISGLSSARSHALVAEGRLMAFELMGHLLSYYRRRAG
jgi:signal transduction histidine kinase